MINNSYRGSKLYYDLLGYAAQKQLFEVTKS